MTSSEAIPRVRLSHHVLSRLLEQIKNRDIQPGDLLPSERQLMDQFQVGRPTVREALQDLQRMGLVQVKHGEGARVLQPTAESLIAQLSGAAQFMLSSSQKNLEHLKHARIFFETGIVRLAAVHAQPDTLAALEECIAEQVAAGDDFLLVLRADIAFHRKIAAALGNPIFTAVSEAMLSWLTDYHVGLVREKGREAQTVAEHRLILERISARDVDGAAAAMLVHLTRASDQYQRPT